MYHGPWPSEHVNDMRVLCLALSLCFGSNSWVQTTALLPAPNVQFLKEKADEIVSVKDFGAKGDGSTDDTAAVQAAVTEACTLGNVHLIWPNAVYAMRFGIIATGCKSVVFDGSGSTLKVPNGTPDTRYASWPNYGKDSFFRIAGADGLTVENFTMDQNLLNRVANGSSESHNSCVLVTSSVNVRVRDNKLLNCMTDGLIVVSDNSGSGSIPKRVWIENNLISRARRNGISIVGGDSITIRNNKIIDTGLHQGTAPMSGIDIEPDQGYPCNDLDVSGNTIKNARSSTGALIVAGTGTTNARIHDNSIGGVSHGIRLLNYVGYENSNHNVVIGPNNTIAGNTNGAAIYINASADFGYGIANLVTSITGNLLADNQYGIIGYQTDRLDISGNRIVNNRIDGVNLNIFNGLTLRDNIFVNNRSAADLAAGHGFAAYLSPSGIAASVRAKGNVLINTSDAAVREYFLPEQSTLWRGTCISKHATGISLMSPCNSFHVVWTLGSISHVLPFFGLTER